MFVLIITLLLLTQVNLINSEKIEEEKKALKLNYKEMETDEDQIGDDEEIDDEDDQEDEQEEEKDFQDNIKRRIRKIEVIGHSYVPKQTILAKIPFKVGEIFQAQKASTAIKNLWNLAKEDKPGFFRKIDVSVDYVSDKEIDVYIILEAKKKLDGITYEGNKHLAEKEIEKKLSLSEIQAIDLEELQKYAEQIKDLYIEKDYHHVEIEAELIPTSDIAQKAVFKVKEGKKSIVKRVFFKGNKSISSKVLRKLIFTREDWLLSFFDKSGSYIPDMLERDRYILANYYQSNGFLMAAVSDVEICEDPKTQEMNITFHIDEGDIFKIKDFSVPGNDILTEEQLKQMVPFYEGELYSKEKIGKAIEHLRMIWGEYGYIYADIEPSIQPNFEEKTVSLTLNSDLGKKIKLNRINIIGNQKTRDYCN